MRTSECDHSQNAITAGVVRNSESARNICEFYGSYQYCRLTCTWELTAIPFRLAGSYRYCFISSIACCRSFVGPDKTVTDLMWPFVPTSASTFTVPVT